MTTTSLEEKSMGLIKMQTPVKQSSGQALEVCRTWEAGKLSQGHISLNITHHQQLMANPSLNGAQGMVLSSKMLEQSQLGNTWGVQCSAEE